MEIMLRGEKKPNQAQSKQNLGYDKFNSSMGFSRYNTNKKVTSKLSMYETNIENYGQNYKFSQQKIDPKGIMANSIYASFSGVVQSLQLFNDDQTDLQITYQIKFRDQWHDETPEVSDTFGTSTFCSSKNGKVTFGLGFDTLVSCMYIQTWPQLLITVKGFDTDGDLITKGYAQIFLPTQPGMQIKEAAVYQIVRNVKWYHKWFSFLEPYFVSYDKKDFQTVIQKGEGRQGQKVRCVGIMKIRTEVLLRNYNRFGYN